MKNIAFEKMVETEKNKHNKKVNKLVLKFHRYFKKLSNNEVNIEILKLLKTNLGTYELLAISKYSSKLNRNLLLYLQNSKVI